MIYRIDAQPLFEAEFRRAHRWLASEMGLITAQKFKDQFRARISRLKTFPRSGRRDRRSPGYFFIRFRHYHAYYRVENESRRIVFVRLWPAARGTPPLLE